MDTEIKTMNDIRIKRILDTMLEEGVDSLDFLYHKNKPTVQKDGDRYEIMSITSGEGTVEISGVKVYPCYEFKLTYLTVDNTWKGTSINHIREIVQNEINRLYE